MCTAKSPKAPAPVPAAPEVTQKTVSALRSAPLITSRNRKPAGYDVLSRLRIPLMIPGAAQPPSNTTVGVA